jgi:GTPase SAR1 family protein
MAPMYYRGSAAAIVCYDVTNEESFSKMKDWVEELSNNVPTDELILVIASNKIDLHEERVVSRTRVEEFAAKVKAHLFETSAKDNIGVDDMFRRIGEEV